MNFRATMNRLVALAAHHGWATKEIQRPLGLAMFTKTGCVFDGDSWNGVAQVNVWATKMTVATILFHPKHGRRVPAFRYNVPWRGLKEIFKNPRVQGMAVYIPRMPKPREDSTYYPPEWRARI